MGRITRTNFGWTVTRRLTNAEILTLFTVPITLIPARAGAAFLPFWIQVVSETTAAVYATFTTLLLGVSGALTQWDSISIADSQLASGALGIFASQDLSVSFWGEYTAAAAPITNKALILSSDADPTGGDPANYAIVTVEGITLETV